jgi:hypothetical protein
MKREYLFGSMDNDLADRLEGSRCFSGKNLVGNDLSDYNDLMADEDFYCTTDVVDGGNRNMQLMMFPSSI